MIILNNWRTFLIIKFYYYSLYLPRIDLSKSFFTISVDELFSFRGSCSLKEAFSPILIMISPESISSKIRSSDIISSKIRSTELISSKIRSRNIISSEISKICQLFFAKLAKLVKIKVGKFWI